MNKLFTAAVLLAMTTMSATAQDAQDTHLVINELMQSNVECIMDDIHEFPDSWVELYNPTDAPINLQGYKIGTKADASKAWQLPNKTIASKGYVIIYCDKEGLENNRLHTDFRLESGKDGNLYLFTTDGVVVDKLEKMAKMPAPDIAYGRAEDGGETWGYQLTPTPGGANSGVVPSDHKILGAPVFSPKGRVVNYGQKSISVELNLPANPPAGAFITYTTDGSEPTANSTMYTEAFQLTNSTAIRAKVFCEGYMSPVSTAQSYIFHPRKMKVPIFSVQTNDDYLNDDEIGLFANNNSKEDKKTHDWRRPVNIEMFTGEDSESIFNQLGETRIQGGQSRANALKSMVFYANKRFDPNHKIFDYEFFPDQKPGVTKFKSFSLRDGGNDFGDLYFRDLIIQRTMGMNTDLDWQAGHTAVLYINGVYMGMLNIRERSNEDNIESNYNGLEDIDMVEISHEKENGVDLFIEEIKGSGDETFYDNFKTFYSQTGHTKAEYEEWMDVSEYLNIMIMNLFYCNIDFPGNNLVLWRPNNDDKDSGLPKRWRFIAKDTDFGLGLYGWNETKNTSNTIDMIYNPSRYTQSWAFTEPATRLFRNMMDNQDIRNLFIDKCCVYMGDFLNGEGTGEMINTIKDEAIDEFVAHRVKYPNQWGGNSRDDLLDKFDAAKSWAQGRPNNFYNYIGNKWNLGTAIPVTINEDITLPANVEVYVNGIKLTKGVFNGKLFKGRLITIVGKTDDNNDQIVTGWDIEKTNSYNRTVSSHVDGATYTFTMDDSYKSLRINAAMGEDPRAKVTIGQRGAVSYSSTKALDFTDLPIEAYIVTAKNGNSFNKKQVYKVPAETGLVVEGAEGTYKIPVAVGSQFDDFTGNLLQSTATAAFTVPDDGNAYYGLFYSFATERVGFQKKSAGFTFGQGKSYLLLPESMAEANINEIFCDETTTIQGVVNDTWTDDKAYNLNGQRVDKNYKGIIILNGKKVVNNRK